MAGRAERVALPVLAAVTAQESELARDGWVGRFIAAPPRLDEMIALYRSLGLEVRAEPLDAGCLDADCAACIVEGGGASRMIFTRKPK
jgi:hypothetical protein